MRRGPSSLVGALLLAMLLAACGTGDRTGPPAPGPGTTTADRAAPDPVSVTITAPDNGGTLDLRGRRSATLVVTGWAAPRSRVKVVAACRPAPCERTVSADGDGRWQARLSVRAAAGQRSLAVSAEPADPASTGAANSVLVLLTGVKGTVRATPAPKGRHRPRPGPSSPTPTVPTPDVSSAPPATPAPSAGPRPTRVFLVGDSLAEGIAGLLPAALPGRAVTVDAKSSRPLATGMQIARASPHGTVLAMSLFTNDDPTGVGRLEAAVRESARIAGPDACAVWATIVRPPVGGISYAAANARLEALATDASVKGTVRVVPWARAVAAHPGWVGADGVHATPSGYRERAALYAQAIDSC